MLTVQAYAAVIIDKDSVKESFSDTIKVSGKFLIGLQLANTTKKRKLHIQFPRASTGFLCIDITSIDGKYHGNIKHEITLPKTGLELIEFKSKYENKLKTYRDNEIAVLATLRKSCESTNNSTILLSSWGQELSNKIILLIRSSARADILHHPSIKDSKVSSICKKIKGSYAVTYDKYCVLEGMDVQKSATIEIQRRNLQKIPPAFISFN